MIVTASKFAEIFGKSNAWVTKQIQGGMPVEKRGEAGMEHEIDSQVAFNWILDRSAGFSRLIADGRAQDRREINQKLRRLAELEAAAARKRKRKRK